MKHTPAPWTVNHSGDHSTAMGKNNNYVNTWINASGGVIARVFPCANPRKAFNDDGLPDTTNDNLEPIGQANARLIAAAPELLEALEVFLKSHNPHGTPICGCTACVKADTAIAKAKGE